MATTYANGRIPSTKLRALPVVYSNAGRQEYLRSDAAASLDRVLLRAVAKTGSTFSIWDAYRSMTEQVAMLRRYYTRVSRRRFKPSDRSWDGSTWAKKGGMPVAASPGHSNHGLGMSIDIHGGAIQTWMKKYGKTYGWVNDVRSEPWHFTYDPSKDRHKAEGHPDVKAIQRAVGVQVDGKFGPATAKAVKAWQKAHGLTADGIPGPASQKKMGLR